MKAIKSFLWFIIVTPFLSLMGNIAATSWFGLGMSTSYFGLVASNLTILGILLVITIVLATVLLLIFGEEKLRELEKKFS